MKAKTFLAFGVLGTVLWLTDSLFNIALAQEGQQVDKPAYLGISHQDLDAQKKEELGFKGEGVLIVKPVEGSPAQKAGVQPNDIILSIGDRQTRNSEEVWHVVYAEHNAGDEVEIKIWRNKKEVILKAKFGERPESEAVVEQYEEARKQYQQQKKEQEQVRKLVFEGLFSNDEEARKKTTEDLKKQGASALDVLERVLREIDKQEKVAAGEDKKVWQARKEGVKKLHAEIRGEAERQIPELLKQLDDDEWKVRQAATQKLIDMGKAAKEFVKPRVEELLKRAQEQKNAEVEYRCQEILEEIGVAESVRFLCSHSIKSQSLS